MKKMLIGKNGKITKGVFKGRTGPVVAFDSQYDEVLVEVDEITCIQISSEYVDQSDNS